LDDKLPEFLLRKAFYGMQTFIDDQETYKNNVNDTIAKYKMIVHCSTNGTFYEAVQQLRKALTSDVFHSIAIDDAHAFHQLQAAIIDLKDLASVINGLCIVFNNNSLAQPAWKLGKYIKRLLKNMDSVDLWVRTATEPQKTARKTLYDAFSCRQSLKSRTSVMHSQLKQRSPDQSWAVICKVAGSENDADASYVAYSNHQSFYNVTVGLHKQKCTAFAASKKSSSSSSPPNALIDKLDAFTKNDDISDDSSLTLRRILGDLHPDKHAGGRQFLLAIANEQPDGSLGTAFNTESFREFIVRRNGAVIQRILLGWEEGQGGGTDGEREERGGSRYGRRRYENERRDDN